MPLITLFDHVLNNDTTAVNKYLSSHPNGKRAQNLSIVYAAAIGNAEMVASMLEHGIPVNTIDGPSNYKRIGFYTKSTLLEQTTPVSFPIIDSISVVSNVSFVGRDFDGAELGHTVTWFEVGEFSLVMCYFVYLAIDGISWGVSRTGDDRPPARVFRRGRGPRAVNWRSARRPLRR